MTLLLLPAGLAGLLVGFGAGVWCAWRAQWMVERAPGEAPACGANGPRSDTPCSLKPGHPGFHDNGKGTQWDLFEAASAAKYTITEGGKVDPAAPPDHPLPAGAVHLSADEVEAVGELLSWIGAELEHHALTVCRKGVDPAALAQAVTLLRYDEGLELEERLQRAGWDTNPAAPLPVIGAGLVCVPSEPCPECAAFVPDSVTLPTFVEELARSSKAATGANSVSLTLTKDGGCYQHSTGWTP